MSVRDQLASALGRNDERPNVALAEHLAAAQDHAGIAELAAALSDPTVAVQNDAIKVLYEIGDRRPELAASHLTAFLALLGSRNNRNIWGALSAIDTVTALVPKDVAARLDAILAAADRSSVIAKDKLMSILSKLARADDPRAMSILLDRLETAATNQLPMYAELAALAVSRRDAPRLRRIIGMRLADIDQPAKRRRLEKVIKSLPS